MSYAVGIDLGTTYTAAAVADAAAGPQMVGLGASGYSVPSVLFLREDGSFLAGEEAMLRAAGDPTRVARLFKRRLGDEVPLRPGGIPFDATTLTATLLQWVVELVSSRRGAAPDVVVLTHPANWGEYRVDLLRGSLEAGGIPTLTVSEPAAAARHYVQGERVEPGELIGVYDLGGGTFDAAIMRRTEDGFVPVGRAGGVDQLGGVDFDDVIWSYVLAEAEVDVSADDDATLAAAYDLRGNCVAAKQLLSVDTAADIRVPLPAATTSVRLTRAEFEQRIRPLLAETLTAFETMLTGSGVAPGDLSRILLVGGSSRIPLVSELLSRHFMVPIAVDSDPKNTVALGAADLGLAWLGAANRPAGTQAATPVPPATPATPTTPVPPAGLIVPPARPTPRPTDARPGPDPTVDTDALVGPDPIAPGDSLAAVSTESGHRTRRPAATSWPMVTDLPGTPPEFERIEARAKPVGPPVAALVVAALAVMVIILVVGAIALRG